MRYPAAVLLLLLLGCCALAFAAPSDKQCFTCLTFNMAKRTGLVPQPAEQEFCNNVERFVVETCDDGCSIYDYGTDVTDKSCADITKEIRLAIGTTEETAKEYLKEPGIRKCIEIGLCSKDEYGKSLDVPENKDFLPRQAFLRDVVAFRAHYYKLGNLGAGVAEANQLVKQAPLTINFDCGIAHLLQGNDAYKNGWQTGRLNSDYEKTRDTIVGQSRYQKEVWGLNFYGEIIGDDPKLSWKTHPEYVQQAREAVWMTEELRKERPKYAGVNMFDFIQGYNPLGETAYGRCVFHLNNDYRDAATLTSQDTLSLGVLDAKYNNERFNCLATFDEPDTIYSSVCKSDKYRDNPKPLPTTGIKVYETLDVKSHFTKPSVFNLEELDRQPQYLPAYEAQLLAQVPLDAAHIDKLACDYRVNFGTDVGIQVVTLAETKGIPLVFYDQSLDLSNVRFEDQFGGDYVAKTSAQVWNVRQLGPFECTNPRPGPGCLFANYPELKNAWAKAKVQQKKRVDPNDTSGKNMATLTKHLEQEKAMRAAMRQIWEDILSVPGLREQSAQLKNQIANEPKLKKKLGLAFKRSRVKSKIKKLTKFF